MRCRSKRVEPTYHLLSHGTLHNNGMSVRLEWAWDWTSAYEDVKVSNAELHVNSSEMSACLQYIGDTLQYLRQLPAPVLEMCLQIRHVFLLDSCDHSGSEAVFLCFFFHKLFDVFFISRHVVVITCLTILNEVEWKLIKLTNNKRTVNSTCQSWYKQPNPKWCRAFMHLCLGSFVHATFNWGLKFIRGNFSITNIASLRISINNRNTFFGSVSNRNSFVIYTSSYLTSGYSHFRF